MITRRTPRPLPPDDPRLRRLERLGYLLDNAISVPGTRYRVGYDAVIGLIPGVGDAVGIVLAAYIILEASRFGLPKATLVRMVLNAAVEAVVGVIPLLGDLFDATWKANTRNLELLHAHLGTRPTRKVASNQSYFFGVLVTVAVIVGIVFILVYLLVSAIVGLLNL